MELSKLKKFPIKEIGNPLKYKLHKIKIKDLFCHILNNKYATTSKLDKQNKRRKYNLKEIQNTKN